MRVSDGVKNAATLLLYYAWKKLKTDVPFTIGDTIRLKVVSDEKNEIENERKRMLWISLRKTLGFPPNFEFQTSINKYPLAVQNIDQNWKFGKKEYEVLFKASETKLKWICNMMENKMKKVIHGIFEESIEAMETYLDGVFEELKNTFNENEVKTKIEIEIEPEIENLERTWLEIYNNALDRTVKMEEHLRDLKKKATKENIDKLCEDVKNSYKYLEQILSNRDAHIKMEQEELELLKFEEKKKAWEEKLKKFVAEAKKDLKKKKEGLKKEMKDYVDANQLELDEAAKEKMVKKMRDTIYGEMNKFVDSKLSNVSTDDEEANKQFQWEILDRLKLKEDEIKKRLDKKEKQWNEDVEKRLGALIEQYELMIGQKDEEKVEET